VNKKVFVIALAIACVVAGGAIGGYLATTGAGPKKATVPKIWRDPILEKAISEGLITGYRLDEIHPAQNLKYTTDDGNVSFNYTGCVGGASCPGSITVLNIDYQADAAGEARAILRIARANSQGMHIRFIKITHL
jgi:hypothetical protein